MIENLSIENVALIKHGTVDFTSELNIISGETGAGKSMLINAVKFMLGAKVNKDFIRLGEDRAVVSGLFSVQNEELRKKIIDKSIALEEDNALLIERTISENGKGTIKLNGKLVSLAILKDLAELLMDIHGQHDHRSLLNQAKHLEILDAFCPTELVVLKRNLSEFLKEYKQLSKDAMQITAKSGQAGEKLEELAYEIGEIEKASLEIDEEDSLNERLKTLQLVEKLKLNATNAEVLLTGSSDSDNGGVISGLSQVLRLVSEIASIDKEAVALHEQLESLSIGLGEFSRDLSSYNENIDTDGHELREIEARLELIYMLKKKYGRTISDVLAYLENAKVDYETYIGADNMLKKINSRRKELNKEITETCKALNLIRRTEAELIERQVETILKELEMKDAKFKISIESKKEFGINGNDNVAFLISPNLGEPLKELAKIASGGEMSRIMLALKTVISTKSSANNDNNNVETFIFDEIDTGVSGRTAQKVAEKLHVIALAQQIICITHLPQIAAMADNHILIEKKSYDGRTETRVVNLDNQGEISEIARLLGGVKVTDAVRANAAELKGMAKEYKMDVNS